MCLFKIRKLFPSADSKCISRKARKETSAKNADECQSLCELCVYPQKLSLRRRVNLHLLFTKKLCQGTVRLVCMERKVTSSWVRVEIPQSIEGIC
jgi:hypothetical protein